jgi:hypothetical protein
MPEPTSPEPTSMDVDTVRHRVRRHALANLMLALLADARRSSGRFAAGPFAHDALRLEFRDVGTLVRHRGGFAFARRDFVVLLAVPPHWPFVRHAQLMPLVLEPNDFAHPNSDGRLICFDLQGVLPGRIPGLLYDNLRLRLFRLDHGLDFATADFVRARLNEVPADRRPLFADTGSGSGHEVVERPIGDVVQPACEASLSDDRCFDVDHERAEGFLDLPVIDLEVGVLGAAIPELSRPTFLRLARPVVPGSSHRPGCAPGQRPSHPVDRARAAYLESANALLGSARGTWHDGPGLVVEPTTVRCDRLRDEVFAVGHALLALGDERIARRYLEAIDNQELADHAARGSSWAGAPDQGGTR